MLRYDLAARDARGITQTVRLERKCENTGGVVDENQLL